MAVAKFSKRIFGSLQLTRQVLCPLRRCLHNTRAPVSAVPRTFSIQASEKQEEPQTSRTDDVLADPLHHEDYFGVRDLFSVSDLFEARVHLGHKAGTRNEHMTPFVFGNRLGVDILDLDQTTLMLGDALNFMAHVAYREGVLLFLSRHFQTLLDVEKTAVECEEYSHCREWKGGTFTNATKQYGLVTRLPDLGIFVSTHNTIFEQHIGVVEMSKLNIPTVGVVDTSCDPRLITYPVPGNDDSPSAIRLYLRLFKEAILIGKAQLKKDLSAQ